MPEGILLAQGIRLVPGVSRRYLQRSRRLEHMHSLCRGYVLLYSRLQPMHAMRDGLLQPAGKGRLLAGAAWQIHLRRPIRA